MLKTLKDEDSARASEILSQIAHKFLPNPEAPISFGSLSEQEKRVVQELTKRLHISDTEVTKPTVPLMEALSQEISDYVLTAEGKSKAKARLGRRGELPLSQYEIEFNDNFVNFQRRFGLRRQHVESAIRNADLTQHLLPERFNTDMEFPITFVAKFVRATHAQHNFWLLVHTYRKGAVLEFEAAWRVYLSDVRFESGSSPVQMLEAFLSVYGINIRVGNGPWSKFMLYKVLPFNASSVGLSNIVEVEGKRPEGKGRSIVCSFSLRVSPLSVAEVACAYAVDAEKYRIALQRHRASH